jgi:hypothetical protein
MIHENSKTVLVVSAVGGNVKLIENMMDDILLDVNDLSQLCRIIFKLFKDRKLSLVLSREALTSVEKSNPDVIALQYQQLYLSLEVFVVSDIMVKH